MALVLTVEIRFRFTTPTLHTLTDTQRKWHSHGAGTGIGAGCDGNSNAGRRSKWSGKVHEEKPCIGREQVPGECAASIMCTGDSLLHA
jgi:hypothetical protein